MVNLDCTVCHDDASFIGSGASVGDSADVLPLSIDIGIEKTIPVPVSTPKTATPTVESSNNDNMRPNPQVIATNRPTAETEHSLPSEKRRIRFLSGAALDVSGGAYGLGVSSLGIEILLCSLIDHQTPQH